jgi:zinc transport system substrate-binding protein
VDEGVQLKEFLAHEDHGEHEEHGEHGHEGLNPHYWLSVENGKAIAGNIARELIRIDPADEGSYRANLEAYLASLDTMKEDIAERLGTLPDKKIITFHNAWFYFANEFGLEIVGTFEPFPGKQPTPRYLADLQETARRNNVRAVFSEPQLSNEAIGSFVSDIGLELYVLDPLGGVEGRESYRELFHYNADVIAKALHHE